ncbi:MAG: CHAT domain-containing protein [Cyclobacteriaceae bacterium]
MHFIKQLISTLLLLGLFPYSFTQSTYDAIRELLKQGDLITAEKELLPYSPITDNPELLVIRGDYYLRKGRNNKAIETFNKALTLFNDKKNENYAFCLNQLAIAYWNEGNNTRALEYAFEAQALRKKLVGSTHESYAASLNDIGLIYSNSNPKEALSYYQEALNTYYLIYDASDNKIGQAHVNMGIIHKNLKAYGSAIDEFNQALSVWKVKGRKSIRSAFTHRYLAETYSEMGVKELATKEIKQALAIYSNTVGKHHPDVASTLTYSGVLKLNEEKTDSALTIFHKALNANFDTNFSQNELNPPPTNGFFNGFVLLNTLFHKATTLERRYNSKSLKMRDLEAVVNHILVADTVIDKLRRSLVKENDKIELGKLAIKLYEVGIRSCYQAHSVSFSRKKHFLEQAYYFAEKSKSSVLLEAISDAKAKNFAGIPASILTTEDKLKADISFIEQKLAQKPAKEVALAYQAELFKLDNAYQTFTKKLEKEYPSYYQLKYKVSPPSIAEIQISIQKKEALIDYFIDESSHTLYVFAITRNNVSVVERVLPEDFDRYISGLRNGISYQQQEIYQTSGYKLYQYLMPDGISKGKITIIPTGRLGIIPFEALLTKKTKDKSYQELPYLINDFEIGYAYSSSLFIQEQLNNKTTNKALLCAPVSFEEMADLPGTKQEVNSINQLLTDSSFTTTQLVSEAAQEKTIKNLNLNEYKYIHLATHGVVNASQPELSKVFLVKDESEDGELYTGELYNLKLNADLVSLSACETGLGKIQRGEGIVGLSRSLLYAGAKNLVVSLWTVSDASTSQLMIDLYQNILSNSTNRYSTPLRSAKQALISSSDYSAPYYWAPFILVGR